MAQYKRIKAKYPDALLLFRVGDFYETFGSDAVTTAQTLGIVLTRRANGSASEVELAGFPHHALETYLPKLVKAGYRVAICDQLEDPKSSKSIVKRGVTELVTPGVALNDQILDHKANNFLAALSFERDEIGLALLDVSTGEFLTSSGSIEYIDKLMQGFLPSEIIVPRPRVKKFHELFGQQFYVYPLDEWIFNSEFAHEKLLRHFGTASLKGFGIEGMEAAITAAGAALHYLDETEHPNIGHITRIARIPEEDHVWLDRFTIRNLELLSTPFESGTSLLDVLDQTQSPMGARLLRKWLVLPLKNIDAINYRLNAVEYFVKDRELSEKMEAEIKKMGDVERIISKVALKRINPRELLSLHRALEAMLPIRQAALDAGSKELAALGEQINPCEVVRGKIKSTLSEQAPVSIDKGHAIAEGVNPVLDELRDLVKNSKGRLAALQEREMKRTGIASLKIGFNNVFGYYLEVRNTHKEKVPPEWIRKQTLVSAERYITDELKVLEEKILSAGDKILSLEKELFEKLVSEVALHVEAIQQNARVIARLDCLLTFSRNALRLNYRRPELSSDHIIDIREGRHPVIEQQLDPGEQYVPNDIYLDDSSQQILIITGPNMSGKSALLRQTALITLMAQAGSFVPAKEARIGIVDKIFTRVGASDNISSGESTFMVEMNETASILNNISDRSLILLDEIGRGTSTYDGISIAWSIAEFLHSNGKFRPKTLFATHYHELNELEGKLERVKNYHVSTREIGKKVLFLRKLEKGGSHHSFGIHVARMAGMPPKVLERARQILKELEEKSIGSDLDRVLKEQKPPSNMQLSIFQLDQPELREVAEILRSLDINALTPVEALMKLNELKDKLKG